MHAQERLTAARCYPHAGPRRLPRGALRRHAPRVVSRDGTHQRRGERIHQRLQGQQHRRPIPAQPTVRVAAQRGEVCGAVAPVAGVGLGVHQPPKGLHKAGAQGEGPTVRGGSFGQPHSGRKPERHTSACAAAVALPPQILADSGCKCRRIYQSMRDAQTSVLAGVCVRGGGGGQSDCRAHTYRATARLFQASASAGRRPRASS
jgi:hypothetical protein